MSEPNLTLRIAGADHIPFLASLNLELIQDEGHRNPMDEAQLADRMQGWLDGEYRAVFFERGDETVGYALYREDSDAIYVRQLFICRHCRRRGLGRSAFGLLSQLWGCKKPTVRLDVLSKNDAGKAFWRALGFHDYCITMEKSL